MKATAFSNTGVRSDSVRLGTEPAAGKEGEVGSCELMRSGV